MTTLADAPPEAGAHVVWLKWDDYLFWLSGKLTHTAGPHGQRVELGPPLNPGEHMPGIGPLPAAPKQPTWSE